MASFVGTTVKLTLRTGGAFVGTILVVDPATATLTVRRSDSGATEQVRREALADVSIVAPAPPSVPASTSTTPAPQSAPVSALETSAPASSSTSDAPSAPAPTEGKKRRNRRRGGASENASRTGSPAPGTNPYEQEFDFTKSTQSFDKKKIWEEIRSQEAENPNLLVNINRNSTFSSDSSKPRQPMLAPNEMVLQPEEVEESHASVPEGSATNEVAQLREQLTSAQSALQRLRAQLALTEALTGLQVEWCGNDAYNCSVFRDARTNAAHWRHKYAGGAEPNSDGVLRYVMHAPGIGDTSVVSLSYGGPDETSSDSTIVERLPEHFRSEITVKLENAPLFQRRIADVAGL